MFDRVADVDRCLWIAPSRLDPLIPTAAQRYAWALNDSRPGSVRVDVVDLRVWHLSGHTDYGLPTEVAAIREAAWVRGWDRYHLFGFSAGGTVALAAARGNPAVRTVAVYEPASIGDDDWHPAEVAWRMEFAGVRALPVDHRQAAFRQMLLRDRAGLPPGLGPAPSWDERSDALEDMLDRTGFVSRDLVEISCPTLILSGALSSERFQAAAERLTEVIRGARAVTLAGCSHLAPPHRVAPDRLTAELTGLWGLG